MTISFIRTGTNATTWISQMQKSHKLRVSIYLECPASENRDRKYISGCQGLEKEGNREFMGMGFL